MKFVDIFRKKEDGGWIHTFMKDFVLGKKN